MEDLSRDCNNVHHIAVKTPRRAAVLKVKAWVSTLSPFRPDGRRAPVFRDLAEAVRPVAQLLTSTRFDYLLISLDMHLSSLGRQDVGVTGVKDGHGGATEELTASGTKLDLYYGKNSSQPNVEPSKVSSWKGRELLLRALEYQCPPEPAPKLLRKTCDIFLNRV